ncbi:MAG: multicopper oxidase domain-containing protein [Anaerolineae bacterium]|nr:multicopper oxidase domain-containing protein [Anaerolineae bacterium]
MLTRRNFIKLSTAVGAALMLPWQEALQVLAQMPALLNPATQPQFVNPMPVIKAAGLRVDATSGGTYTVRMAPTTQSLGLVNPLTGTPLTTPVWGYSVDGYTPVTYPGATFVARKDVPLNIQWVNALAVRHHLLPVDSTLHWALGHLGHHNHGMMYDFSMFGGVPVVPHLHGGHTESDSDGLPEYWWTPGYHTDPADPLFKGPRFVKSLYRYDNDQEGGTLWYHDHALGITRLNVYAGLAGFYFLRDANELALIDDNRILSGDYEIEIVIQDRMFAADGSLFYPADPAMAIAMGAINPPDPTALPEFFGNFILVNGKAWPVLDVEPTKYRFRLLNGSDSRFYSLWINTGATDAVNGPLFTQIGSDDGFLNAPVPLNQLTLGPGERADVVVDFAGWQGQTLIVRNNARVPFPRGATVNPRLDGQIMAFRVGQTTSAPPVTLPAILRSTPYTIQEPPVRTRQLVLFEAMDKFGRLQPLLGIIDPASPLDGTLLWDEAITEVPNLGDVEIWEIFNATVDAHPIHLHLVTFEVLNRQKYTATILPKSNIDPLHPNDPPTLGGKLTNIQLKGRPTPAAANERGPKDTAQMFPGEVTRIKVRFDRPGRYVWHCHILSHEDHEMMRPYYVGIHPAWFYPQSAAYWAEHRIEGANSFDFHWLQIGRLGSEEVFLHGLTYGAVMTPGGNEWHALARQVITARLNVLAGVTPPAAIQTVLQSATAQLTAKTPNSLSEDDKAAFLAFASALAGFNGA